jgi:hypothetical protein
VRRGISIRKSEFDPAFLGDTIYSSSHPDGRHSYCISRPGVRAFVEFEINSEELRGLAIHREQETPGAARLEIAEHVRHVQRLARELLAVEQPSKPAFEQVLNVKLWPHRSNPADSSRCETGFPSGPLANVDIRAPDANSPTAPWLFTFSVRQGLALPMKAFDRTFILGIEQAGGGASVVFDDHTGNLTGLTVRRQPHTERKEPDE